MFDKKWSAKGKYEYLIQIDRIALLMNKYNYAAKIIGITERTSGKDVTDYPQFSEHHGVWPEEARDGAAKEADAALGEVGMGLQ